MKRNRRNMGMYIICARGGKHCLLGHFLACQDFHIATSHIVQDPLGETFDTSVRKDGADDTAKTQETNRPEAGEENHHLTA
jgi:hypothetical protein